MNISSDYYSSGDVYETIDTLRESRNFRAFGKPSASHYEDVQRFRDEESALGLL